VIITKARLQLALDSNLRLADLQRRNGVIAPLIMKHSLEPRKVLALARCYGLKWCKSFTLQAAKCEQLEVLQWLHKCGCPTVINWAVYKGQVRILAWVCSVKADPCGDDLLHRSLTQAGRAGSMFAVEWLRAQGARWPDSFVAYDCYPQMGNKCGSLDAVMWALANRCTWGNWRCQDLAPDPVRSDSIFRGPELLIDGQTYVSGLEMAAELFMWAHQNPLHLCPHGPAAAAAAAVL
jgi:hypothetical protein